MDQNEILHDLRHLVVPLGAYKMISKPTIRSAQTVHLSWIRISTISKWTETSFHLSLVSKKCHLVQLKWFLSLWYVWQKPCTYLALKLTQSPSGPKWDSTRPTSPRSTIGVLQKWFYEAMVCLVQTVDISCTDTYTTSKRTEMRFYITDVT
jgi:hypothetical protein